MGRAVDAYFETAGPIRGVIVSQLASIPVDVSTYAGAVSGVSLRRLLIGTIVGELPWTVPAAVVGASAATVTAARLGTIRPVLVVGCLLTAGVLLAGPVYRAVTEIWGQWASGISRLDAVDSALTSAELTPIGCH